MVTWLVAVSVLSAGAVTLVYGFGGGLALGVFLSTSIVGFSVGAAAWILVGIMAGRFSWEDGTVRSLQLSVSGVAVASIALVYISSLGRAASG
jgi:hypothetical protein